MPNGTTLMSARYEQEEEGNPINGYYTFNTDIRGSVTNILNNGGTLTTGYVYDEYGNQIKTGDEDFLNEATYTGAIYDDESELYYMNARYYSASTGQFTTRDTYLGNISNPATHNLYTYTGNNPINYIDPTGHCPMTVENTYGQYSYWDPMDCFFEPPIIAPVNQYNTHSNLQINNKVESTTTVVNAYLFEVRKGICSAIDLISSNANIDFHETSSDYYSMNYGYGAPSYTSYDFKNYDEVGATVTTKIGGSTQTFTASKNLLNGEHNFTSGSYFKSNIFMSNTLTFGKNGRYISSTNITGPYLNGLQKAPWISVTFYPDRLIPVAMAAIVATGYHTVAVAAGGIYVVVQALQTMQ